MVKFYRNLRSFFSLGIVLFFLVSNASAATILAELNRNPVLLNESFILEFEAEGTLDGDPDFSSIEKEFDILRQSQGSSTQIINGEISHKKKWTLSLMAKAAGSFIIPPIAFGSDLSQSLHVEIKEAAAIHPGSDLKPLFIEVFAEPSTAYVQSQVIFTVRLYRTVNLVSGNLSEPSLSDADAVIEKLGDDRSFDTSRDGQRYLVVERVYAIFPQQSGRLTVSPVLFEGQVASQSRSLFGPFSHGGTIKRFRSEAVELEVLPVPQDKMTGRWLPARDLRFLDRWEEITQEDKPFKAGEPFTRTLTLVAEGLTAAQLPEVHFDLPDGFKSYPDQPVLEDKKRGDGIVGIRKEKIALIPTQAGSYRLPAIEIPWWNTMTKRMEVARLEERHIDVMPAEEVEVATPSIALQKEASGLADTSDALVSGGTQRDASFWSLISMMLGLGWALTLVAWWGSRQKRGNQYETVDNKPVTPDTGPIKRQLKKACMQNEAEAAKEALLSWGLARWPRRPVSLGEVRKRVGEPLAAEIRKLNGVLYSRETSVWRNGSTLWEAFEQEARKEKEKIVPKPKDLAPMVP